ncbi:winged helix DNA-binding protein [Paenibacillus sp. R14(2021)]|uniref:winged helix DNA-binding protein n=1 Tax=Paenibacillus sp. R14(2021) TaxID=2859228 RepID=UPI001C6116DE|nr:winged helix DNA-binding protein [Paenibacillus sp. R14(2021)]
MKQAEHVNQRFEQAYAEMMKQAMMQSSEERKRRLKEQDQAAKLFLEKVWWPAVGQLNDLHPEYELKDIRGGTRFADFAYLPKHPLKLIVEVDGFGPHWRDISRWKFADDLFRQNHLLIDGWQLLRFAFDEMNEKPGRCQQTLLMGLAKWGGMLQTEGSILNVYERAILQLMQERLDEMSLIEITRALGIHKQTAAANLRSLADKGLLHTTIAKSGRIMRYRLFIQIDQMG